MKRAGILCLRDWHYITLESEKTEQKERNDNSWEPQSPEADQRHVQWAQASSNALAPYALKGGYINMLDEGEQERVLLTFGANYKRLLELKRMYDPEDVFHSTIGHIVP